MGTELENIIKGKKTIVNVIGIGHGGSNVVSRFKEYVEGMVVNKIYMSDVVWDIEDIIKGSDVSFIIACLGSNFCAGAAPVIACKSRGLGITTVGIGTLPFRFEGKTKFSKALESVGYLTQEVDAACIIDSDYYIRQHTDLSVNEAFLKIDAWVCEIINKYISLI